MSTYAKNKILDAIFNSAAFSITGDAYVSLHTASPGTTGANEASGGSYARLQVPCGNASGGALANTGVLDFLLMPACTVTHIGIWDAVTTGNFIVGGALAASKAVNSGDTFELPVSSFNGLI